MSIQSSAPVRLLGERLAGSAPLEAEAEGADWERAPDARPSTASLTRRYVHLHIHVANRWRVRVARAKGYIWLVLEAAASSSPGPDR
jgi:hypothetical protein